MLPAVLLGVPLALGAVEVLPLPACCVVVEVVVVVVLLGAAVVPEDAGAELAVELPPVAPGVELVLPAMLPVDAPVFVLLAGRWLIHTRAGTSNFRRLKSTTR